MRSIQEFLKGIDDVLRERGFEPIPKERAQARYRLDASPGWTGELTVRVDINPVIRTHRVVDFSLVLRTRKLPHLLARVMGREPPSKDVAIAVGPLGYLPPVREKSSWKIRPDDTVQSVRKKVGRFTEQVDNRILPFMRVGQDIPALIELLSTPGVWARPRYLPLLWRFLGHRWRARWTLWRFRTEFKREEYRNYARALRHWDEVMKGEDLSTT
jgi:hypothetical protein